MGKTKREKQKRDLPTFVLAPSLSYVLLAAIVLFFGLIRVRLLNFPLERDEGEYAYAGQLILHRIAPYQLCYSMKLPGTSAAYALFLAVFGQTPAGVHLGLLLVNSATIILLFFLASRLFGRLAGVVAAASFALLSIGPSVLGFAAHATQFVVLPAVGGILLLLKAIESKRLSTFAWSGLLLGLAFLMKQPGIFFFLFALLWLLRCQWKRPVPWRSIAAQSGAVILGFTLPLLLTVLVLMRAGVMQKFWFWTFSYASQYGTIRQFSDGLQTLWESGLSVAGPAAAVWIIAAVGVVALFWNPDTRRYWLFTLGFLAFSFAAVCPGLYFRPHYFVLLLPAVALLCAVAVSSAATMLVKSRQNAAWAAVPSLVFLAALGFAVIGQREFFFEQDPITACRSLYSGNPFPEALKIADFLKNHSAEGDRIAVIGSEPEIYFYSGRRSATGYVYMYPLMESQPFASTMQTEMISEIEASRPQFLVFVNSPTSWLRTDASDSTIFSWSDQYAGSGYQLVGIADLFAEGTEYHFDDAATYRPRSDNAILVFKRLAPPNPS